MSFAPAVKKRASAATIYRERLEPSRIGGLGDLFRAYGGEMDLSETMSTCLRRFRLIQDKVGISAPIQGYPGGFKVIRADLDFPTAIPAYPGRFKVICGDSRLSAPS